MEAGGLRAISTHDPEQSSQSQAPGWAVHAPGLFLLLTSVCAGLAIYLYRLETIQTLLLVMAASLFLGAFTFSLIAMPAGADLK